jgi:hypothetical protein
MRNVTPAEVAEMKAEGWDLEDVKLGPVEDRYVQPSLVHDNEAHERTLREARDVAQRVEAFNEGTHQVRNLLRRSLFSHVHTHASFVFR